MPLNARLALFRAAARTHPLTHAFLRDANVADGTEPMDADMSPDEFLRQLQSGQLDGVLDG